MYDAIVVGARAAGSPTAMLLARKGYRVLLLDKTRFPSDTLSTHFVHVSGAARLKRWGLLDAVAASNCPPVRRYRFDVGPFALTGAPPPVDGVADGYAPRRTVLDTILVGAAVDAGAELREHFGVSELLWDGDRVSGIRGQAAGGAMVTERASMVIGADGMRSLVARSVQAPSYHVVATHACMFYTYWSGVPLVGAELYPRPGRMIACAPTNDGLISTTLAWPTTSFNAVRADIERSFWATFDLVPELAERIRGGTRAARFFGTNVLPGFFRRPHGPGWALVGDAGYHKDPITAQGISDAFRDAELLAEAIHGGLSGAQAMPDALAAYERQRNEAALPMYGLTNQLAALQPPAPEMAELFGALQHNQEQTNRFIGTIAGTVAIPDFYAPENIGEIMGAPAFA